MILLCERRRQSAARWGREAGFTLIEVIVTLTILGFALALISGYKQPWSSGLGVRGTAAQLAGGLRLARSEAILRNPPIACDPARPPTRFRLGAGAIRQLPSQLSIALLTIVGERRDSTTGDIRFNPDGSSTGGRLTIAHGTRAMAGGV